MPRNNRTGKAVRRSLRPDSTRGIWRLSPCLAEFVRPAWPTPGPAPSAREPGAASTLPLDQVHPKSGGKIRPRQLRGNATSERRFVFSVELQSGRLDHAIQICRSRPRRHLRSGHDGYRIRAGKHRCAAGGGSATAARVKAHHREKTILRPSTTTGMSRGTPGARHNFYKESGN